MELTLDTLNAMWKGKRGAASPVRLMGFRGGLEPAGSPTARGVYDDLIVVIIGDSVTYWRAAVDPAPALIAHPVNPDGAAQLCEGVHYFERHWMHGKYAVLGQAESVHVNRLNTDGTFRDVQFGDYGICIHSGGAPEDVLRFTAGCQIIHNADGYFGQPTWGRFFVPIIGQMMARGLDTVPYLLTSATGLSAPTHLEN